MIGVDLVRICSILFDLVRNGAAVSGSGARLYADVPGWSVWSQPGRLLHGDDPGRFARTFCGGRNGPKPSVLPEIARSGCAVFDNFGKFRNTFDSFGLVLSVRRDSRAWADMRESIGVEGGWG